MRYPALESLRGLAALVVVVHHYLLVFPALYPYPEDATGLSAALLYTPLHLIWAGGEAVVLFFLLSGFVLSLGVWQGKALNMRSFIVKRIWRIWVPFMVAVLLAYFASKLIGAVKVPGASLWFNTIWQQANAQAFQQHILMLGNMDGYNHAFIPVVWSLKWEMWGSLLLPLVLVLAHQSPSVALAVSALFIGLYWQGGGGLEVLQGLMRYLPMFVIGAVLAKHREGIITWLKNTTEAKYWLILSIALLLLPVQWYNFSNSPSPLRATINDYDTLLGASMLLCLALGWDKFSVWLQRPNLLWLGRISFSLYLYHSLILTIVVRLSYPFLPLPLLLLISFALTFVVSHYTHKYIEVPAMNYGKKLAAAYE